MGSGGFLSELHPFPLLLRPLFRLLTVAAAGVASRVLFLSLRKADRRLVGDGKCFLVAMLTVQSLCLQLFLYRGKLLIHCLA